MARQTFTEGQTVYVKRYGSTWDKATVVQPEIAKRAGYGSRKAYYVGVKYDPDNDAWRNADRVFEIINNRQHIVDEAAYQAEERARVAAREARDRATREQQERALERYRGYALRVAQVLGATLPLDKIACEQLARALFVDFEDRGEWQRRDRRALIAKLTGDESPVPSLLPERDEATS